MLSLLKLLYFYNSVPIKVMGIAKALLLGLYTFLWSLFKDLYDFLVPIWDYHIWTFQSLSRITMVMSPLRLYLFKQLTIIFYGNIPGFYASFFTNI